MKLRVQDKQKAIMLRKQGLSYREIREQISVSKGTLSGWLADIELSQDERKILEERTKVINDNGRLKTSLRNRELGMARKEKVRKRAHELFELNKDDPFFVLGLALYWAEGAKKNDYFSFINSDPEMMKIMQRWVNEFFHIEPSLIKFRLYIHEPYKNENCELFWIEKCAISPEQLQKTTYKPTPHSVKRNIEYKGCLRMVFFGVHHLETIKTWQKSISEYYIGSSNKHP